MRHVKDGVLKEDSFFLLCNPLTTTTNGANVKKLVYNLFRDNGVSWNMVSAVCSDGAPAMLGRYSDFGALVTSDAPSQNIDTHCVLHSHALVAKTMPPKLTEVLKIVVKCVNYARKSVMKHRFFKDLGNEMYSEIKVLLTYNGYLREIY